jgi:acyl-CoA thioester hydrolase
MSDPQNTPPPRDRSAYKHWTDEFVRFNDLDPLGHANNNAIGTYFDSARVGIFSEIGVNQLGGDVQLVVAKITFEFLAELKMHTKVQIGQMVARMGNTSIVLKGGVFAGDKCVATGDAVCVLVDGKTHRPIPLTDEMRQILQRYA